MNNNMYVTQPFLPDLEKFYPYLKKIWDSKWLTNKGQFHKEFEEQLADFLNVNYVSLFANGTLALIIALKSLELSGEVITTPFTFPATTHALWWNDLTPVFCDIERKNMNIDPKKIEGHINKNTQGILPVHVYGYPCNVEKIREISKRYNLRVIYDAAHAFNVKKGANSILNFGDLSILSFHATKIFHTFEGGAIISHNKEMKQKIDLLKNFGIANEVTVKFPGINAKMNEFQAALGILQLQHIDEIIKKSQQIVNYYRSQLESIKGISYLDDISEVTYNYAYFPIFVDKEQYGINRDQLYEKFKKNNIHVKRYFYPLTSHFPPYNKLHSSDSENLKTAEKMTRKVICLPMYPDLKKEQIQKICKIIKKNKR